MPLDHLWWMVTVVGISFVVTAYLFTHSLSLLKCAIPIVVLLGLCAYLAGLIRR